MSSKEEKTGHKTQTQQAETAAAPEAAEKQTTEETAPVDEKEPAEQVQVEEEGKKQKEAQDPEARIKALTEKLEAVEKEKAEIMDRLVRASADFDNYKKRMERQWADFKKYAHETLVKELLSAVDNLERALEAAEESSEDNGLVKGVNITLSEITKILEQFGVTPISSKGEKFDPNYHQAISTEQRTDTEENTVVQECQKGYMLHDRLLRPAMVVVSVAPEEKSRTDSDEQETASETDD